MQSIIHSGYERTVHELRDVVTRAARRFVEVPAADPAHAVLCRIEVPSRAVQPSVRVRSDVDLKACRDLRAVIVEGDCLSPHFHDGDIQFFELGRPVFDGDIVLLRVPDENGGRWSFGSKVLHRRGELLLLLCNEPPVEYTAEKQARFVPCGVMVAALHYPDPTPRSLEVHALLHRNDEDAAAAGYEWSPAYLNELGLIGG